MEKTWRWFGKKDKITLDMLRQIGVEGAPARPDGKPSELASIGTQQRPPSKYFNDLWYS